MCQSVNSLAWLQLLSESWLLENEGKDAEISTWSLDCWQESRKLKSLQDWCQGTKNGHPVLYWGRQLFKCACHQETDKYILTDLNQISTFTDGYLRRVKCLFLSFMVFSPHQLTYNLSLSCEKCNALLIHGFP